MTIRKALTGTFSALAVMAALGTGTASADDLKLWTLSFDSPTVVSAWKDIIKAFEAKNPGITVMMENRSTDEHKAALRVAARSDQGPDIYFMWAGLGLGGEFVNAGLSKPLDSYYAQYKWDDRLSAIAGSYSKLYPGGRHGVPYTFHGEALYYNKALFTKAGIAAPPTTYAELKADAAKLKAAGIPAFTFGGSVNWHLMRLMDAILESQCGADKHDALKAMKADWASEPCATASFKELKDWSANYTLSPFMGIDQSQSFKLFLANRAAMMLEGDWLVGQIRDAGRLADFDVFPIPTGTDRLYSFAEYYYVSSKSKAPDAAAKFLDYLLSDEVQQKYLGVIGSISVNAHVKYDNVDALNQRWLDIFAKYTKTFVNGDQAFPLNVTTEYFRVINEVASGSIAPENGGKTLQIFISANK
ncbi:ABC transporter substrate-binding protein [Telmatospirillum sp.]|uniref:ABC transporter substrate-binding protein n=1 Tax=Telmatospirillum sp. TaxID=2079197 RepID=UPI00284DA1A4|nr:ABC transporter substrate-binding protein [Telmatospirillum sp.]MDR3440269.1 ABC transporter substrate-binding protein [Telmatospirillum sp.]